MTSLGSAPDEGESERKHDIYFKGPVMAEVYKRLTDDSAAIRDWEVQMWGCTSVDADGVLRMSLEDACLFHSLHMRHDFGNRWFGLRRVADAWLLDCQLERLDTNYVDGRLEAMSIARFRDRMYLVGASVHGGGADG